MNEIESAVKDLRRRRKAVMDAITETDLGKALERIDAALVALTGEPANTNGASARQNQPRPKRQLITGSVRSKAQQLLDEADTTWTYDGIIAEWESRGDPISAADPKAALRTALWAMVNADTAVRIDGGSFKSSKFAATPEEVE